MPIIMLTAKSEDADKLMGFECGADAYVTKPFNILELKARVRALLRRAAGTQRNRGAVLTAGDLSLNTEERVAIRDGKTVDLTAKEYDLIELLMRNPRRVYSRENLMNVVWGYAYAGDYRTVDVHIRRLRERLEKNPAEPEYIDVYKRQPPGCPWPLRPRPSRRRRTAPAAGTGECRTSARSGSEIFPGPWRCRLLLSNIVIALRPLYHRISILSSRDSLTRLQSLFEITDDDANASAFARRP